MLRFTTGDIFQSGADIIVIPVNTKGVMGAGLAKQFKEKRPDIYEKYRDSCLSFTYRPGSACLFQENEDRPYYLLAFTKDHWKYPSKEFWVADIIWKLWNRSLEDDIYRGKTIAIPALGCGLGGLSWAKIVKPLIVKFFDNPDVKHGFKEVIVYEPGGK